MRFVLMGTGPFAVPSFEMLRSQGHEILAVISRPEANGPKVKKAPPPSPVRLWAESHGLPSFTPLSMNTDESVQWLKSLKCDLLFVCDYGQILSQDCLAASRLGGINLHGSLLPRHRGAAPVQWSILAGDAEAGATIIHMTPGLDAGPILSTVATPIGESENAQQLETRLSELGTQATAQAIEILEAWDPATPSPGLVQDSLLATKAPRLSKQDGALDCSYPSHLIDRQIRGLQPWPGCYANIRTSAGAEIRLLIQGARPISDHSVGLRQDASSEDSSASKSPAEGEQQNGQTNASLPLGSLMYGERLKDFKALHPSFSRVDLAIRVRDGWLVLETVQPAGKRSMAAADFVRGYAKLEWMRVEDSAVPHKLLNRMQMMENAS